MTTTLPATPVDASPTSRSERNEAARQAMLGGPILPVMLRLALPTIVVLVVQTLVSVAETYFVSSLGTAVLAGVTLVFPVVMLMTTMSNGGVGGGVAAAIARATGAGRQKDADALLFHSLVLAVAFGLLFTVGAISGGPWLYRALGGKGDTLTAALLYSNVVFAGTVPIWVVNLAAAALRGTGNVRVPAFITLAGAVILIPLSPALIFGFGPIPRLGVAGAGVAVLLYYLAATAALVLYLVSGRGGLRLSPARLEWRWFQDILSVGGLSALGTVQSNLTVVLVTGAVGRFGANALAGYGIASRLDYLLIPLLFGLGTGVLTLVGVNVGAGQIKRARRIAWIGAALAAIFAETVGLLVAAVPDLWLRLFSADPAVLRAGTVYLHRLAPFYGFVGLGFLLYFAAQGAGRVGWPFAAGSMRLLVAAGLGWWMVTHFGADLGTLFIAVASSSVLFGTITALSTLRRSWGEPVRTTSA